MLELIVSVMIGCLFVVHGRAAVNGNASFLHSHHFKRVTQEDMPLFCKSLGLGLLILGSGIVGFAVIGILSLWLTYLLFTVLAFVCLAVGVLVGLPLCLYAMIKYNKGIF